MLKYYIKNMVCNRCVMAVKQLSTEMGLKVSSLSMGEMELENELDAAALLQLRNQLESIGFELLDDQKQKIIEKIKNIIIGQVHHAQQDRLHNLSDVLADQLNRDYSYLSNLFSDVEGTTIEKYAISQKIEKAKELIIYDELTLSEIADQLGYSSVAHLSNQFKKVTGLTPSHFKKVGANKRKPLDKV
ncbi:MAG TPA: AraC family transcriptional regulator [Bacteroidia bacterium]